MTITFSHYGTRDTSVHFVIDQVDLFIRIKRMNDIKWYLEKRGHLFEFKNKKVKQSYENQFQEALIRK